MGWNSGGEVEKKVVGAEVSYAGMPGKKMVVGAERIERKGSGYGSSSGDAETLSPFFQNSQMKDA